MDLDIVFLGTSASAPSAQRAPTAILVRRGGERLLFDCAEGTQRQLMRSTVGLPDLEEVFLTHFHADHYLGLPGMLKTFSLRQRELPLTVYGPPGLRDLYGSLKRVIGKLSYPVEIEELRVGEALDRDGYRILVFPVHHGVSAVGYALVEDARPGRFDVETADALGVPPGPERGALQRGDSVTLPDGRVLTPDAVLGEPRPGRRIVIPGDTAPVETVRVLAEGADVLVHEATFAEEERERAEDTLHSTALQAGRGRARRRRAPARPDAHLTALLRQGARGGSAHGLPGDGRAARLRRDRSAVRRARRAAARQSGCAARAHTGVRPASRPRVGPAPRCRPS